MRVFKRPPRTVLKSSTKLSILIDENFVRKLNANIYRESHDATNCYFSHFSLESKKMPRSLVCLQNKLNGTGEAKSRETSVHSNETC